MPNKSFGKNPGIFLCEWFLFLYVVVFCISRSDSSFDLAFKILNFIWTNVQLGQFLCYSLLLISISSRQWCVGYKNSTFCNAGVYIFGVYAWESMLANAEPDTTLCSISIMLILPWNQREPPFLVQTTPSPNLPGAVKDPEPHSFLCWYFLHFSLAVEHRDHITLNPFSIWGHFLLILLPKEHNLKMISWEHQQFTMLQAIKLKSNTKLTLEFSSSQEGLSSTSCAWKLHWGFSCMCMDKLPVFRHP